MKAFIKTVALTLVISVTALFFSSYKKVEAAGVGAAVALDAGLYIIAAIATGIASCLTVEVIKELNEFVESNYFADSFTKDEEGLFSYHPLSDNQQMDAVVEAAVAQYNNKVKNNEISSGDTSSSLSSEAYSDCVSSGLKDVLGSGSASGITSGISVINGKPQKVTTIYAESTVEIFDYLQLDYNICSSVFDMVIDIDLSRNVNAVMTKTGKYLPFIIQDDKLYVMSNTRRDNSSVIVYTQSTSAGSGIHFDGEGSFYLAHSYMAFRIANVNGQLCKAFFGCSRVSDNPATSSRKQQIYGNPKPTTYPILFTTPSYFNYGTVNTSFENYEDKYPIKFINAADATDILSDDDIINHNYNSSGYFIGTSSSSFSLSSSIGTAGKMMSGTENAVQGGTNTTYSELSDIEKAIYALAKQQGITYEEMLEQSNLVVENGQIYLEGLDGVTHSIESLLSEFDKLLEQGDITNENIAASTEQLKAILEYLKGLNIEGLGSYIQQLETTLDGLKQGDEDREAILGDVLGQLQGLNNYLDSLGLSSVAGDISQIKSEVQTRAKAIEEAIKREEEDRKKGEQREQEIVNIVFPLVSSGATSYKLYDQCKFLLDNLFNYNDVLEPPDFSFYWDSNGDGEKEIYNPFNLSFLETKLTGENMVDKSWFPVEIKVIDVIRYVIAIVIYGLFAMRLIKRLPTFYGSGFLTHL